MMEQTADPHSTLQSRKDHPLASCAGGAVFSCVITSAFSRNCFLGVF
jgi:hypothetical protein